MTTMLNKIAQFYRRYRTLNRRIDRLTNLTTVTKSVLGALLLSLLMLSIPVLLVINMFIYTKLHVGLSILLVIFAVSWSYLYYDVFYRLLHQYHEPLEDVNTRLPQLVESTLIAFILLVFGTVLLLTIF